MKKLLLALAFSTAALVPSATVRAADLDVPPPPPVEELRPATYDWTGIYVGAWVGATCVDGELTEHTAGPPPLATLAREVRAVAHSRAGRAIELPEPHFLGDLPEAASELARELAGLGHDQMNPPVCLCGRHALDHLA